MNTGAPSAAIVSETSLICDVQMMGKSSIPTTDARQAIEDASKPWPLLCAVAQSALAAPVYQRYSRRTPGLLAHVLSLTHSTNARLAKGRSTFYPNPMAADGQRYASPDASICETRASACVSMYSRMFVSLPFRTAIAKTKWSSNVLFVALTFPLAKPTTRTRLCPCTNEGE